jgi:Tol biopolymer transport system component
MIQNRLKFIAAALLLLSLRLANAGEFISFPGEKPEVLSPNGKFIIYNIDSLNMSPNHILVLIDKRNKLNISKLYGYSRSVDVSWSPDGTKFLLNDHGGSDFTNCFIYALDNSIAIINIKDEAKKKEPYLHNMLRENHHAYIEGVEWINNMEIKLKAHGYGDKSPDGFSFLYGYKLGGGFKSMNSE